MPDISELIVSIGQQIGRLNPLIEFASSIIILIFFSINVQTMRSDKEQFKIVEEKNENRSYYYIISESVTLQSIDTSHCYKYNSYPQDALTYVNYFGEKYLLAIGIIWIFIHIAINTFRSIYEIVKYNKLLMEQKRNLHYIESFCLIFSYVLSNLLLPITGINYETHCAKNIFTFIFFTPMVVYIFTIIFLILGLICYFICIQYYKKYNPIWALIMILFLIHYFFFKETENQQSNKNKEDEDKKKKAKYLVGILLIFSYFSALLYSIAFSFSNSSVVIIVFNVISIACDIIGCAKKQKELNDEQQNNNAQVQQQP